MFSQYSEKCGKLLFLSQADAEVKIIEREADKNNGWRGKSYQCQRCKYWHISTMIEADFHNETNNLSIKNIDKFERRLQIEAEKLSALKHQEKIKKIKEDNHELRKLAKMQLNEGTTKHKSSAPSKKSNNDYNPDSDKNRVIDSFGDNSKNSILNNVDSETLAKLKKKLL